MATWMEARGQWQARLRMPDGTRKPFYGDTEEEAEALKADYLKNGERVEPEIDTLHSFAMRVWLPGVQHNSPNTLRKYKTDYQCWIKPNLGSMPIASLRREHCQELCNLMAKEGKSANTIKHVRALLSSILNVAMDEEAILRNPCRRVKTPKAPKKRVRIIPPAKAYRVLTETKGATQVSLHLSIVLGLREGEVSALTWDQVNRIEGTITIDRQHIEMRDPEKRTGQKRKRRRGNHLLVTPTKNRENRTISVPRSFIDALDKMGNLDCPFVVSEEGAPLSPQAIRKRWNAVRESFGLAEFTFHDTRHAAAGLMHGEGTDLFTIRDTLGHSTLEMTHLYTGMSDETQRDALTRVWEAISVDGPSGK